MYVTHTVAQTESHQPPKSQVDLSMPHVDSRDTYQSSYNNSHTGEIPPDYALSPPAQTAFQSNIYLQDGNNNHTPHQSTQMSNFVAHTIPDADPPYSPKHQVDLSMPHVDPRESYQSSYRQSHRGEAPTAEHMHEPIQQNAFQSNVVLEGGENVPRQSTQKGVYVAHPVQEVKHYVPPKAQVDFSQPGVDARDSYQSSYSRQHQGRALSADQEAVTASPTTFKSSFVLEDGEGRAPASSTNKERYPSHPIQEVEYFTPAKGQIYLAQPDVDPKESFQSSYKRMHTGENLSERDEISQVPHTAFQSSLAFRDGSNDQTPQKSSQRDNYPAHPTPEKELYSKPAAQISLSHPNVALNDSFKSSYSTMHRGDTPSVDEEVTHVAGGTAFQSSINLGDNSNTTYKSSHKDNYPSHEIPEREQPTRPKPQIDLSQPNVDSKDSFQSSYQRLHTGEASITDNSNEPVARTTFQSSISLSDGDKYMAPQRSTQRENYPVHQTPERENYTPAKPQVSLAQPGVDPKETFQSSYQRSHKGDVTAEREEQTQAPRTAFQSTLAFDDGEKNRTPQKSTQRENYPAHQTPEREQYSSPKPQISLAQPGVDPKDSFETSYQRLHKGDIPVTDDESSQITRTAFQSSIAFADGEKNATPRKSTQKENYPSHPVQEVEKYTPRKGQISLSQPNVDPKESFQSSYSRLHTGEHPLPQEEHDVQPPRAAFQSSLVFEDGEKDKTPRRSTQKENYPAHQTPEKEQYSSPKPQISLAQPGVDPKETFQSSYQRLHKGDVLTEHEEQTQAPRTAFQSSLAFDDGEKNRTPQKSTQKENYPSHPMHEVEHYTPPKAQISLSQPHVDPKEAFQTSYQRLHTGDAVPTDEETKQAPQSTFKSSIAFDDGDKHRTPQKSTQRENYPSHPTQDIEHYGAPRGQLSLAQPNVDPKESFQSSYSRLHKGDTPSVEDEVAQAPRTALQSSVVFDDGDRAKTPRKSTQKENYPSHPVQETEAYLPPKSQISLAQPNVDPKESFQSSYQRLHKGDATTTDDEAQAPAKTAFQSSISLGDGYKHEAPGMSTQRETYPSHPVQEVEQTAPRQSHFSLSQPNVDPKESFQSSYSRSHTGSPAVEEESPRISRTAFQSSLAFEDGEKNRTPRKSTQKENYPSHPFQEVEQYTPPKSQISLAQPNVDPKESFQSSYSRLHKGEHPVPQGDVDTQITRTAFQSSLVFEDAEKDRTPRKSTQKENYPAHQTPEREQYSSPKPQISLAQPNVDPKDSFKSSYSSMHRGDTPVADEEVAHITRSAFQSSLDLGDNSNTPLKSTQKENYPSHPTPEVEQPTRPKPQIDLTQPNVDSKESFQSSYKALHKGELPATDEPAHVPRTAFQSSIALDDGDKHRTPRSSTQRENYPSHPAQDVEKYTPRKGQISLTQPNVDPKESFQSSYSRVHTGEHPDQEQDVSVVPRTAFKSSVAFDDGEVYRTPQKSTNKDNYPSHPVQDNEVYAPPKSQISLTQPNVDPKEAFQSSYHRLHTGEALAEGDHAKVPRTAFQSSISMDDGDKARTPQRSTQRDNYPSHPVQEVEHFSPAKSHVSLSQPNVDPKDTFQSSYQRQHAGYAPTAERENAPVPKIAFQSSITLDDGDKNRTPMKSTNRENYPTHPAQEIEHYTPPRPQVSLAQPNVDPKEAFQTSYSQLHKGEIPADEATTTFVPRAAFQSSLTFEDGESRTPQRSTARENYPSHPTPEPYVHHAPKPQISLAQPNVDSKESFQSSYSQSHKGEMPATTQEVNVPRTTFKSSLAFEDGEKHHMPQRSNQHDTYPVHNVSGTTQSHQPPKPQISLSQPNVDPKEMFQSSYKQLHTGELPSSQDEVAYAPRTTFQSTLTLEDLDPDPTPRQSLQHEEFPSHPLPDTKPIQPPKSQISLTQPNVDPKESFQSSYQNLHKGTPLPAEDEVPIIRTTFKSNVVFSDGDNHSAPIQSTQKGNYVAHAIPDAVPHHVPKPQVDLSMPEPAMSPKRAHKDAYKGGERPAAGSVSPSPTRNAFQSSISFGGGESPQRTTPKSAQRIAHEVKSDTSPYLSPKSQPQSRPDQSPQINHKSPVPSRVTSPIPDDSNSPKPPRRSNQSTFSLNDGLTAEPMVSTSKRSFASASSNTASSSNATDEARFANAGRNMRSSFSFGGSDSSNNMRSPTSHTRAPQEVSQSDSTASRTSTKPVRESPSTTLYDKERGRTTQAPTSRESYNFNTSPTSNVNHARPRPSSALGGEREREIGHQNNTSPSSRPKTPPSRRPGDLHRSSIQFASTGDLSSRMSTTGDSSYTSPSMSSNSLSPTPLTSSRSPTLPRSSPSLNSPTPNSPASPYKPRGNASTFSLGSDNNTSYLTTTNRSMYNSPASPTPSKSPTPTRSSPAQPTASPARNSHLRSSFSLG